MRPYPDELLRSMNQSLTEVIIPNIDDDWARYVARSMEKMIAHLELRWRHELEFLALDTVELDELLRELRPSLEEGGLAGRSELNTVRSTIAERLDGTDPLPSAPDVAGLNATNDAYRGTLQTTIEGLEAAAADDELRERLEPLRERIRAHLRRELDRDMVLAEPTNMLFGPPLPKDKRSAA
jgi:hypothetical protein